MSLLAKRTTKKAASTRRKHALLNKFLSKTYHMIDQCDPSIATWSSSGDSFTVKDVHAFEEAVLPKYFNHSKFSSFLRQMNFYGFQKMRSDPDLQVHTGSVRFCHEFFRKGQPELLHKIQRTTAKTDDSTVSDELVEELKQEVHDLRQKLEDIDYQVEKKMAAAAEAMQRDYMLRTKQMEAAYEDLFSSLMRQQTRPVQQMSMMPSQMPSQLNHSNLVSLLHANQQTV